MAGNVLFKDPDFQKLMRSRVKRESLQASGRKGYEALCAKGKGHIASQKAAQWRQVNPSNLERVVITWLDELKVNYQREVEIGGFYADFVINTLVIEVNGQQWHELEQLRQGQKERDKGKYQAFTRLGYTVLVLPECDIKSGKSRELLQNTLKGGDALDF